MHSTPVTKPKAVKKHVCMSCGEAINPGDTYCMWVAFDAGTATTNKMHQECLDMHVGDSDGYEWEYTPFSHERPEAIRALD